VRALAAGFLMMLALTSCTSPTPDTGANPQESAVTASTLAPSRVVVPPRIPVSLPCSHGMQQRLVGARHNITGEVFAPRLVSPPSRRYANKILWSSRQTGPADLLISASLNGTALQVERRVEGDLTPGPSRPSTINVPKAGCWTFSLKWSNTSDLVAVRYGSTS
jgi:hypothetical protein